MVDFGTRAKVPEMRMFTVLAPDTAAALLKTTLNVHVPGTVGVDAGTDAFEQVSRAR
jgi:glycine cleavage system regulatory protein